MVRNIILLHIICILLHFYSKPLLYDGLLLTCRVFHCRNADHFEIFVHYYYLFFLPVISQHESLVFLQEFRLTKYLVILDKSSDFTACDLHHIIASCFISLCFFSLCLLSSAISFYI